LPGRADDLGGGVFKKRLNDNQHRSIVLAKGGKLWEFAFLYAKKDRANIDPDELAAFRKLAQAYAWITPPELEQALDEGDLLELSDDHWTEVQERCIRGHPQRCSGPVPLQKWWAGTKRPSGMALKLLAVVEKHGLKVLA